MSSKYAYCCSDFNLKGGKSVRQKDHGILYGGALSLGPIRSGTKLFPR